MSGTLNALERKAKAALMLNDNNIGIFWSDSASAVMDTAFGSSMEGPRAIEAGLGKLLAFSEITAHSLPDGRVAVVRAQLLPDLVDVLIDVLEIEVLPAWAINTLLAHEHAQRGTPLTPP